jgi:hypothetical protein
MGDKELTVDDAKLDQLIDTARSQRPGATIYLLPREDGQYSDHSTDVIALLEEAGVSVDYATDPMAGGVFGLKSADLVLPPLLILVSDAATLAGAISGVVGLIRWFTRDSGGRRSVSVEVTIQRDAGGSSRRTVSIAGASADEAERLLKQAGSLRPPK